MKRRRFNARHTNIMAHFRGSDSRAPMLVDFLGNAVVNAAVGLHHISQVFEKFVVEEELEGIDRGFQAFASDETLRVANQWDAVKLLASKLCKLEVVSCTHNDILKSEP